MALVRSLCVSHVPQRLLNKKVWTVVMVRHALDSGAPITCSFALSGSCTRNGCDLIRSINHMSVRCISISGGNLSNPSTPWVTLNDSCKQVRTSLILKTPSSCRKNGAGGIDWSTTPRALVTFPMGGAHAVVGISASRASCPLPWPGTSAEFPLSPGRAHSTAATLSIAGASRVPRSHFGNRRGPGQRKNRGIVYAALRGVDTQSTRQLQLSLI